LADRAPISGSAVLLEKMAEVHSFLNRTLLARPHGEDLEFGRLLRRNEFGAVIYLPLYAAVPESACPHRGFLARLGRFA